MAALEDTLPRAPPSARLRANTAPSHMFHLERVRSVIQEKQELERKLKDIDSIIEERRSIYMSSRPGSIYAESSEPMPDLSASELELLPVPTRPKTAPIHIPARAKSFTEASRTFTQPPKSPIPPPPLPLVLPRPPLRKKKSFSHISAWLFPTPPHSRNISLDSLTNDPKPLTTRQGFYQCVDMHALHSRAYSSASSRGGSETEGDGGMVWTPESSPTQGETRRYELARMTTFGERTVLGLRACGTVEEEAGERSVATGDRLSSVGVAF